MHQPYDALLIVAFGGPEGPEDVIPFLENVLRGRNVPRERMLEVAEHYDHFGGVSPLNGQVRELIEALRADLVRHAIDLPCYWGNRNWHPLLTETMQQMADDGIKRALALVLAAFSSYSSCRQYRDDIRRAQRSVGNGAPAVDKVRVFYNYPDFIAANAARLRDAVEQFPDKQRKTLHVIYTAHSIPFTMASCCDYELQLAETCRMVSAAIGIESGRWRLAYQSRSGRPQDPWLEPDICTSLAELKQQNGADADVVVMPIGFLSDHLEVLYDLDEEAQQIAEGLGLNMIRASTVGTHPVFVGMLRQLVEERLFDSTPRRSIGRLGPNPDVCPDDCCPAPARPNRTRTT